jgi:ATP-binding cassette subfamily B protein RaxB
MTALVQLGKLSRDRRLPVMRSSEQSECALACLAMISSFHGHKTDLNALRTRFAISSNGLNLRAVMVMAGKLGLGTRPLRLEMEHLARLSTPAILHWDMNHFVVLAEVGRSTATIHDPARGRIVISLEEVADHFTGIAVELAPNDLFVAQDERTRFGLSGLWSRSRGLSSAVAQILALSLAIQLLLFLSPLQVQLVVDQAIAQASTSLLLLVCAAFLFLMLLQAMLEAARAWTIQIAGNAFAFSALGNLVAHTLRLPVAFFEKRHIGDILSRLSSVVSIQQMLAQGLVTTVIDGLMGLAAMAVLFIYSPALAAIVLASVVAKFCVAAGLGVPIRRASLSALHSRAVEQSFLMETLRGITTLRTMGGEAEREGRWRNLFMRATNDGLEGARHQTIATGLQSGIAAVELALVVYFAATRVIAATGFSVGMLVAFLAYRQIVSDRLGQLLNQVITIRLVLLHTQRLSDIAVARPEMPTSLPSLKPRQFPIVLRQVGFRYGSEDRIVLDGIDLTLESDSFVAITGPSGSGKSTLLSVLLGLYPPTSGSIEIGGERADCAHFQEWRRHVGVVRQDDRLFSGSLAENISFFDPDMNMVGVMEAAHNARIHDDIDIMPMKYQSLVGDMGSSLSGGQHQRVLLARALYRRPKLLILDEGTANLDEQSEGSIVEFLKHLRICRLAIAHRPRIVDAADHVYSLEAGRLHKIR